MATKTLSRPKKSSPVPVKVADTPKGPGSIAPRSESKLIFVQGDGFGSSGTQVYAGYFAEDYLVGELHGHAAADAFDKMRRGDAKIKMALNAVKTPIISSPWEIQPAGDSDEEKLHAEFIEHVLFKDMDRPFSRTELLTIADFGFTVFEVTHKVVLDHPKFGTYIGLKALGWRSPRSILSWKLDPTTGDVLSVHQLISGDLNRAIDIPGEFLIINTLEKEGDNWEGISLLRAAYGAWKRKNLYLKLMAIGNERNAVPTPTAEIPAGQENSVQFTNLVSALKNYVSHENSYLTFPAGWKIDFIKSAFDPEKLRASIDFENSEMVGAFMANFLLLGSTQSGSRAVSMDQSQFFLGAIQYVAHEACAGINHKLIPQLIKMKYGPQPAYPTMKVTGITDKAGRELADSLARLCESQVIQPDDQLEEHVRRRYGFPKKSDVGVRFVKPKASMEPGDNVEVTDDPEKVEEEIEPKEPAHVVAQPPKKPVQKGGAGKASQPQVN